jgi:hypothetical protein
MSTAMPTQALVTHQFTSVAAAAAAAAAVCVHRLNASMATSGAPLLTITCLGAHPMILKITATNTSTASTTM